MSTYNMEKQHKLGKLHALERICMLLDEDSFREIGSNITNLEDAFNIKKGQFPYDGVITGYGTIGGQKRSRFLPQWSRLPRPASGHQAF